MGDQPSAARQEEPAVSMLRLSAPWVLALLIAVAASAPREVPNMMDDSVLDDLDVSQLQDPDTSGELVHEDADHMTQADMAKASKVYDVLYPSDDDGDLGESGDSDS